MSNEIEDVENNTDSFIKINSSFLTKQGYFKTNCMGTLVWTINGKNVDKVQLSSNILFNDKPYIHLLYEQTDPETGAKTNFDYKIYLKKVNSIIEPNKYFFYFVCPLTSKITSILYKSSGNMFLHREAYRKFADNPLNSKDFSNLENKFGLELENKISKLRERLKEKLKTNHKKVPLKLIERVKDLEDRVKNFILKMKIKNKL